MQNLCTFPSLSAHFQTMVPIFRFAVRDPPKPLMDLFVSLRGPSKSSMQCDMHAEHLLSMPIVSASVSKNTRVSCCAAEVSVAMDNAEKATMALP